VHLPGGELLTVRPVTPADVDGLVALYDGLSEDDRYRRFFTGTCPPRRVSWRHPRGTPCSPSTTRTRARSSSSSAGATDIHRLAAPTPVPSKGDVRP
jgi:hypothetical protein